LYSKLDEFVSYFHLLLYIILFLREFAFTTFDSNPWIPIRDQKRPTVTLYYSTPWSFLQKEEWQRTTFLFALFGEKTYSS